MDKNLFDIGSDNDEAEDKINLDYDFNTEYGDGDIPEIDKPKSSTATNEFPEEIPNRNKSDKKTNSK